jgi:hypothetical protein
MTMGMMWLEQDSKKTLEQIVKEGVEYYQKKYKKTPKYCYVSSSYSEQEVENIIIKPYISILSKNFWFTIDEIQRGKSYE